jgi:prepilin-type processing-associated H-X9-DG protein
VSPDRIFTRSQRGKFGISPRRSGGFSLLELLLVMTIIFIVFTLMWSSSSKSYQTTQKAACGKNLQTIYVALKTYSIDANDRFPTFTNAQTSEPVLSQLIPRCTTSSQLFICPGSKDSPLPEAQPFADAKISYAYYMGHTAKEGADQALMSDRQVNTDPKLRNQLLFSADGKKPGANHNKFGGNVLFCDGNLQSSPPLAAFDLTNAPNIVLLNPKP